MMIRIEVPSEKLMSVIRYLKTYYPDFVRVYKNIQGLNVVVIERGLPLIIKYYGLKGDFRIELGSYLSDIITISDYISITIQ